MKPHTHDARVVLEFTRAKLREMKWLCLNHQKQPLDPTMLSERLGSLADYISERIDVLDENVFMRSSMIGGNWFEVRIADKQALTVEDMDFALAMLNLSRGAIERTRKPKETADPPATTQAETEG
jgi:hypothetical protein